MSLKEEGAETAALQALLKTKKQETAITAAIPVLQLRMRHAPINTNSAFLEEKAEERQMPQERTLQQKASAPQGLQLQLIKHAMS